MKNIIIIDVDALMPTRLGLGGNLASVSPTLNKLAETSLHCTNVFSMGNPTEFALPGLFASAYLLDANGSRYGISDNDITFAEVLKKHGYHTTAFMTAFRPAADNYDRGFDDFYNLIDLQVTEKNLMNTGKWYQKQYHNTGRLISKDECVQDMIKYYEEYLSDMLRYCDNWDLYKTSSEIPKSAIFHNVDYNNVRKAINDDKILFENNRSDYIIKYLSGGELGISKIAENIRTNRNKKLTTTLMDIKIRLILLLNIFLFYQKSSSPVSAKNIVGHVLSIVRNGRKGLLSRYPSGQYIFNIFSNWLNKNYSNNKPFFVYMKLMDVHEMNVYSHDIQNPETNNRECQSLLSFLSDVKADKKYSGNVLYDAAIRYNDEIIKNILNILKNRKIIDNTIVVITADHGGQFPNLPVRDNDRHRAESFADELYKIPLILKGNGIPAKKYEKIISSVDINTTLLEMVGINSPPSFRGMVITDNDFSRDYVISENQGRGPFHLKYKPIRVSVRSEQKKIVYISKAKAKAKAKHEGVVTQAFDLSADPEEYVNLAENAQFINECKDLITVAKNRVKEILS